MILTLAKDCPGFMFAVNHIPSNVPIDNALFLTIPASTGSVNLQNYVSYHDNEPGVKEY